MLNRFNLTIVSVVVFLSGCATQSLQPIPYDELVIVEPVSVAFEQEKDLAQTNEILNRVELTDEQQAQLLYLRGVSYDSVGLTSLSRLDFVRALNLKVDMVEAYNFLGIYATLAQNFDQAYDYFDSVVELKPDHQYVYLNRGIALYYGNRPKLAGDDFSNFFADDPADPYRMIWLYLSQAQINPGAALIDLQAHRKNIPEENWASNIVDMMLDNLSEGDLLRTIKALDEPDALKAEKLCEAYFYMAKHRQLLGDSSGAETYFKLALSTNVMEFVEFKYARLELDFMHSSGS